MKLDDVFGTENRFLLICWSVAVALVLLFGFVLGQQPIAVLGFAESREYQVNFDTPVEIRQIHVMPGQQVRKGDLLLELGQSELDAQLRMLRSRFDRLEAELQLRQELTQVLNDRDSLAPKADPLKVELEETRREVALIEERLRRLSIFSEVDGTVGAVNFKNGEKAPAFSPLITLLPLAPTYVNAYINESLSASFRVGQKVEVISATGARVKGKIVSMGARIVPIPERLLRIQTLPAWGREVVVKIPGKNSFLLGEKVSVQKRWALSLFNRAKAHEFDGEAIEVAEPQEMSIPPELLAEFQPEFSGLIYQNDLRSFLLISDDYPKDKPHIFLMTKEGQVKGDPIEIQGLARMEDIESISARENELLLLSSLSATRKNKIKESRQQLVRIKRSGYKFVFMGQVDLRRALLKAMSQSSDPVVRKIFEATHDLRSKGLEVEGHFTRGKDLFLALKGPVLRQNEVVILQVSDFESLYRGQELLPHQISLAAQFFLKHPRDIELVVTDVVDHGGDIYLATSCRSSACSSVWRYSENKSLELLQEFGLSHLEGIALGPEGDELFGVFDIRGRGKFVIIPVNREAKSL